MNESRRFKRMVEDNYRMATKVATISDTMSSEALVAIVRHQCRNIVDESLLTNNDVMGHALLIMTTQN